MSQPDGIQTPPPRWTAGAVAVFVLGLLILVPSGLCTGLLGFMSVVEIFQQPQNAPFADFLPVLAIGGPFIFVGALLIRTAWRMRKRN